MRIKEKGQRPNFLMKTFRLVHHVAVMYKIKKARTVLVFGPGQLKNRRTLTMVSRGEDRDLVLQRCAV